MRKNLDLVTRRLVALKRFIVFLPGVLIFVAGFFVLFPSLDKRLPASFSLFLIYVLSAYVTIPLAFRLWRIARPPTHLPRYCVTPDGLACDPVNIAISATRGDMIDAMKHAGWYVADRRTVRSVIKLVLSIVLRRPYPNAPFSTLYLFGRGQDIGFQKPLQGDKRPSSHKRHHVRFWACIPALMEGTNLEYAGFWENLYPDTDKGEVLWVGCASRDVGIAPIKHNFQLTHRVRTNTDEERSIIIEDLKNTGHVEEIKILKAGDPLSIANRALSSSLTSDGTIAVIDLK
jgi:hypothetical protein